MDKNDRLNSLLASAIKDQTKVLIIPSIIAIALIVVVIVIWVFTRNEA